MNFPQSLHYIDLLYNSFYLIDLRYKIERNGTLTIPFSYFFSHTAALKVLRPMVKMMKLVPFSLVSSSLLFSLVSR